MRRTVTIVGVVLVWLVSVAGRAEAFILINEILADPAAGMAGDANGDGVGSSTQDEFIEFYNAGSEAFDLSGFSLSDNVSTRQVFSSGTLLPAHSYFVLFGGGAPDAPGVNWQKASTGTLGLNNTGDTLSLYDPFNVLIQQVIYGSLANHDQSITRSLEGTLSEFVLHSSLPEANGKAFSPGTSPSGTAPTAAVPEPASLYLLAVGMLALAGRKRG